MGPNLTSVVSNKYVIFQVELPLYNLGEVVQTCHTAILKG